VDPWPSHRPQEEGGIAMSALSRTHRSLAIVIAVGILSVGTGAAAIAATPDSPVGPAEVSVVSEADDVEGPQFYTGVIIDVSGVIDGDVYASGQSITISGDITGDVIAAAQTITITGSVDGDVRLAGQDVTVTGDVTHSGTVFAANVTVADGGSFGDDLVAAGGRVSIAGEVGRDVVLSAGELVINGTIGGNVTYVSEDEARIADGAVAGTVERIAPPQTPQVEVSPWAVFAGWVLGVFYALVALSLITLIAGLLLPRWLHQVTDHLVPSPWKALLVGFVAFMAVPVALLFLLITIIGAPLALAGMLVWILMLLATFVYGAYYLGRLVLRRATHPVVTALVGGVILIVALQIPWLNVVVWFAMVFFGLGAQLLEFQRQRPWHLTTKTRQPVDAAPAPDQATIVIPPPPPLPGPSQP
jgi:cytoskeletal protein CcmA (bactofilin family)